MTHIVHHSALVNPDGTLDLATEQFSLNAANLVATAHANKVAVLLNVAQPYWRGQTTNFQQAVTKNLPKLLNSIMTVVNTYGYDGVDIDWEPFEPSTNGAAMKTLAAGLKPLLGTKPLTAASSVTDGAYWATAHTNFARVNVMSYDLAGTWNPYSWHNSALYDQDGRVWSFALVTKRYTAAGFPAAKLGLGLAFYGWQWGGGVRSTDTTQGINAPRQNWVSGKLPTGTQICYNQIAAKVTSSNYHWDSLSQVPYINADGSTAAQDWYITYDNPASIQAKVKYVAANNLGGWIIWSIGQDYFPGGAHPHPLMDAVQAGSVPSITATTLPAATQSTAYSTTIAAVGAAPVQWTLSSGTLPTGLKLSSAGVVSGTPSAAGTFSFVVEARNFSGSVTKSFQIAVTGVKTVVTTPVTTPITTTPVTTTPVTTSPVTTTPVTTPVTTTPRRRR